MTSESLSMSQTSRNGSSPTWQKSSATEIPLICVDALMKMKRVRGWKFLNKSRATTLKYFRGETTPSLETAFIVAKFARELLDQIVVEDNSIAA